MLAIIMKQTPAPEFPAFDELVGWKMHDLQPVDRNLLRPEQRENKKNLRRERQAESRKISPRKSLALLARWLTGKREEGRQTWYVQRGSKVKHFGEMQLHRDTLFRE